MQALTTAPPPLPHRYLKPERAQDASTAHAKEEIASAISMLERAALEQNHSNAAMQLVNLYLDGISPALRPDPVRAKQMLTRLMTSDCLPQQVCAERMLTRLMTSDCL